MLNGYFNFFSKDSHKIAKSRNSHNFWRDPVLKRARRIGKSRAFSDQAKQLPTLNMRFFHLQDYTSDSRSNSIDVSGISPGFHSEDQKRVIEHTDQIFYPIFNIDYDLGTQVFGDGGKV